MEDRDKIETTDKKMEEITNKYKKLYQYTHEEGFIEGLLGLPELPGLPGLPTVDMPKMDNSEDFLKKAFEPVTRFFDRIKDFFDNVGKGFTNFGKGMEDIFKGIFVDEPTAIGKGLGIGFDNISQLLLWIGEFLLSNMVCGMYFMSNLNFCFFYYLMDIVGQILYMPVRFGIWMMFVITQKDINPNIDQVWSYIYMADKWIFNNCGFHIAHWSVYVRNRCYNCRRLKSSALQRKAAQVEYNFNTDLPNLVSDAATRIFQGEKQVKTAFKDVSFKL